MNVEPGQAPAGAGIQFHAANRPDHAALVLGDRSASYSQFENRVRRMAHMLSRKGVSSGDVVGLMVPNAFEWFEVIHGASRLGAITVPVNVHFKAAEVQWILTDSGAKLVVVDPKLEE